MAVPASPVRRVLADKAVNATLQHRQNEKPVTSQVPNTTTFRYVETPKQSAVSRPSHQTTPKAGQKRRFEDLDIEQTRESTESCSSTILPYSTDTAGEPCVSEDRSALVFEFDAQPSEHTMGSFMASQEPPLPLEDQFEIRDEMSQQTLDKMHATPLPQNTSQLQPPLHLLLGSQDSQESLRMSSFIDFDSNELERSDTKSASPFSVTPTSCSGRQTALHEVRFKCHTKLRSTRKELSNQQTAETLRTRLQLALYKVQTNQISKPFARLDRPGQSSPELPPQLSSAQRLSPESRIAAARARATMQKKPLVKDYSSIPVPKIMPTAFSARYLPIDEPRMPSSPPISHAEGEKGDSARCSGRQPTPPLGVANGFPKTPVQLNSPPGSEGGATADSSRKVGCLLADGLTSSVVKGEAANGLLELMRAAIS